MLVKYSITWENIFLKYEVKSKYPFAMCKINTAAKCGFLFSDLIITLGYLRNEQNHLVTQPLSFGTLSEPSVWNQGAK